MPGNEIKHLRDFSRICVRDPDMLRRLHLENLPPENKKGGLATFFVHMVQIRAGSTCQRTCRSFIKLNESLTQTATAALVAFLGNSASVLGAVGGILLASSQIQTLQGLPGVQAVLAASIQSFS